MKYVVDTNFLKNKNLESYLYQNNKNKIILTEYAAIESYKGQNHKAIESAMVILEKFPNQVLIAKCTIDICGKDLSNSSNLLIDNNQTDGFYQFCKDLRKLKNKKSRYRKELDEKQEQANRQINRIKSKIPDLLNGMIGLESQCNENDIKELRKNNIINERLENIVKANVIKGTSISNEMHPSVSVPQRQISYYDFIFRTNICAQMLFLWWIKSGSPTRTKQDRLVNDIIDINFATFSLYFDGLMTNDKKLKFIYRNAFNFLNRKL